MTAFNRLLHAIESKIQGRLCIAYHRTHKQAAKDILKEGLRPSISGHYGPGTYFTWDLESQLRPSMVETYGPVVIKARVNLNGFLFFDENVGKEVYGRPYSLKEELVPKVMTEDAYEEMLHKVDPSVFSSELAKYTMTHFMRPIHKHFKGIEYIGRQDGKCLVVFKTNAMAMKPIAYSIIRNTNGAKPRWVKFKGQQEAHTQPDFKTIRIIEINYLKSLGFKVKPGEGLGGEGELTLYKDIKGQKVSVTVFSEGYVHFSYESPLRGRIVLDALSNTSKNKDSLEASLLETYTSFQKGLLGQLNLDKCFNIVQNTLKELGWKTKVIFNKLHVESYGRDTLEIDFTLKYNQARQGLAWPVQIYFSELVDHQDYNTIAVGNDIEVSSVDDVKKRFIPEFQAVVQELRLQK